MASRCFFLDRLPPELRLMVYENLLIAKEPIRGETARKDRRYGLDMAVLRVNRQIYEEAKAIFYGKNTFYITSSTDGSSIQDGLKREGSRSEQFGQLDPPLPPRHLHLIRHLTLDLIYYPSNPVAESDSSSKYSPTDEGAAEYINALTRLLHTTTLHTLHLTASPSDSLSAKNSLATFFTLDAHPSFFSAALASLSLSNPNPSSNPKNNLHPPSIPLSFEFPDCFYHTSMNPTSFLKNSILLLACQVMFSHSQMRIAQMMRDFERGDIEILEDGRVEGRCGSGADADADADADAGGKKKVDLEPLMKKWPERGPGMREVVVKAKELEREMTLHELWLSRMS